MIIFIIVIWGRGVYGERTGVTNAERVLVPESVAVKTLVQKSVGTLKKHKGLFSVYLQPFATVCNNVISYVMTSRRYFLA